MQEQLWFRRLKDLFDLFILDSFPSAHRTHPSLVGFAQVLPTCAGRLLEREVKQLDNILTVAKSPFTVVLGGSKVDDRLKAIKLLIKKERADHVLLNWSHCQCLLTSTRQNKISIKH